MMKLQGLLPITFRGTPYNIPVCVWVPQHYPNGPPIPYVQPTANMDVVHGHQHVGGDGMCYFPYLNQWQPHSSNAAGLLEVMVQTFSAHPPVTAKAAPPVHAPAPAPPSYPGYPVPVPVPVPAPAPRTQPAPAPAPPPEYQMSQPERMVTNAIVAGMNERRQELNTEMSELLDDQQRLEAGRTQLAGAWGEARSDLAGQGAAVCNLRRLNSVRRPSAAVPCRCLSLLLLPADHLRGLAEAGG